MASKPPRSTDPAFPDALPPDHIAHGAHTDFRAEMSYGAYLRLPDLLSCQTPVSDHHDEMLFIVIHQSTELWMKLMIHELSAAVACLRRGDLRPAFKMMARVSRTQAQLIQSWDVLSTLTPADYLEFRDKLGHSSGFQSYQYRAIEYLMGNKRRAMLAPHRHDAEALAMLTGVLEAPSIYDEAIRLLAARGFAIDADEVERDWSVARTANDSVREAWLAIYRDTATHWDLYELGEELVDLEDSFQQWRFRHLMTVERIIGLRTGTGGTSGSTYLRKALDIRFFPELWDVRTLL